MKYKLEKLYLITGVTFHALASLWLTVQLYKFWLWFSWLYWLPDTL